MRRRRKGAKEERRGKITRESQRVRWRHVPSAHRISRPACGTRSHTALPWGGRRGPASPRGSRQPPQCPCPRHPHLGAQGRTSARSPSPNGHPRATPPTRSPASTPGIQPRPRQAESGGEAASGNRGARGSLPGPGGGGAAPSPAESSLRKVSAKLCSAPRDGAGQVGEGRGAGPYLHKRPLRIR